MRGCEVADYEEAGSQQDIPGNCSCDPWGDGSEQAAEAVLGALAVDLGRGRSGYGSLGALNLESDSGQG